MYEYHFLSILKLHKAQIVRSIKNPDRIAPVSYQMLNIYPKYLGFNAIPKENSKENWENYTLLE